jgi:hypothetical protein
MDNDYFTGYNDAIEDVQKEAGLGLALSPTGGYKRQIAESEAYLKARGKGHAFPRATWRANLAKIREGFEQVAPGVIKETHQEVMAAVAKAKKVAGKKWLTMKPTEQALLMSKYMSGA